MLNPVTYQRRTFIVDVVKVTIENMQEVADWCKGRILTEDDPNAPEYGQNYIKVDVTGRVEEYQTKAWVGTYVLRQRNKFKVYKENAFHVAFELPTVSHENANKPRESVNVFDRDKGVGQWSPSEGPAYDAFGKRIVGN